MFPKVDWIVNRFLQMHLPCMSPANMPVLGTAVLFFMCMPQCKNCFYLDATVPSNHKPPFGLCTRIKQLK